MKKPRCITISGLDGSGKTTLANWLVEYLKSKGYKTKYVWIRSPHTFAYLISRILLHLGWRRTFRNPNGIAISRFKLYEGTFARKIWPAIEFLSVLPLIIFKVKLPLLLGYRIVLDRYTIDTTASIALTTRNMSFADSFLGKLLLKMIPKERIVIFLDADYFTVLKRRPDIHNTSDEIRNWITLYRALARKTKAFSLNTSILTIEHVRKKALDLLFAGSMRKISFKRGMPLDFSIVIPTCNRATWLKGVLASILEQEILPKEVIVVDQSDNRLTFNVVKEMKGTFLESKILLEYFYIKQKSASKARNLGLYHSKGEIIFFIDDDVILSKDYTKNIMEVYENYPDAVGVQGNLIENPKYLAKMNLTIGRLENQFKRAFFLSHFRENTWNIMPSINDVFPFPLTNIIPTQRMQGCCSFKRRILEGFKYDENLEGWSYLEDFDLSYRVYKSKYGSLYVTPKAKLTHKRHTNSSNLKIESYKKIVNRTYLFFKLIKPSLCNCAIFCWSIFGLILTTTLGAILGRREKENQTKRKGLGRKGCRAQRSNKRVDKHIHHQKGQIDEQPSKKSQAHLRERKASRDDFHRSFRRLCCHMPHGGQHLVVPLVHPRHHILSQYPLQATDG